MLNTIFSVVIVGAAIGFAWFYMQRRDEERAADKLVSDAESRNRASREAGLADGDRPLFERDAEDPIERKILDDGDAHNSKWVSPTFRAAFWQVRDRGGNLSAAFEAGMDATCWRRGSREQVYERLFSAKVISEGEKNRLIQSVISEPDGHGPGC